MSREALSRDRYIVFVVPVVAMDLLELVMQSRYKWDPHFATINNKLTCAYSHNTSIVPCSLSGG